MTKPVKTQSVSAPLSLGDFLDRLSILRIKNERISDPEKSKRNLVQLQQFEQLRCEVQSDRLAEIETTEADLKAVNEKLWDVETDIRKCEARADFGTEFVRLARRVYELNDRRSVLKQNVDQLVGSHLAEQKDYG